MNRTLYFFGIFFIAIYLLVALIQSLIYFQLGAQIYSLQSFLDWFVFTTIINLIVTIIMLKYFHYKAYRFAFFAAILIMTVMLSHFIILYNILVTRELQQFFLTSFVVVLVTGIIYALSLIFSKAGERPWLKAIGIFLFIQGVVLLSTLIWSANSGRVQSNAIAEKISQWAMLAGSIFLFPYILNFVSELKTVTTEKRPNVFRKSLYGAMGVIGIAAILAMFIIGTNINVERHGLVSWNNRGPERALQLAEPFEARTYVGSQGDTMRYRLLMPLDYDPQKEYPLVVSLHGGGGCGTDNVKQIEGSWMAQMLSNYGNRKKYSAFVLAPQCPPGSSWGGIPNLPIMDLQVFETIGVLEEEFNIDQKRRYVLGESLGGYGSWHFICARPEVFAAAIPVCGGGNPELARNIVDVPVWAFHGAKDRSVPVNLSRNMIEAIKTAGGNPKYTEFPAEGHIISKQLRATPGLLDWLFEQKRD